MACRTILHLRWASPWTRSQLIVQIGMVQGPRGSKFCHAEGQEYDEVHMSELSGGGGTGTL